MNDVFEHFVDPIEKLEYLMDHMTEDANLIIDFPDFYSDEGVHHWKAVEHLWFFKKSDILRIGNEWGFNLTKIEVPIPGKLVFYFERV